MLQERPGSVLGPDDATDAHEAAKHGSTCGHVLADIAKESLRSRAVPQGIETTKQDADTATDRGTHERPHLSRMSDLVGQESFQTSKAYLHLVKGRRSLTLHC